ncbi:MAG: hypothetical protein Q7S99_09245 [Parvibaculum sp.]|nr:hypothetical protein [Parvibaculum sp.]
MGLRAGVMVAAIVILRPMAAAIVPAPFVVVTIPVLFAGVGIALAVIVPVAPRVAFGPVTIIAPALMLAFGPVALLGFIVLLALMLALRTTLIVARGGNGGGGQHGQRECGCKKCPHLNFSPLLVIPTIGAASFRQSETKPPRLNKDWEGCYLRFMLADVEFVPPKRRKRATETGQTKKGAGLLRRLFAEITGFSKTD